MSRMGPHVNTTHRANVAADYIRAANPDVVKVLDSGMDSRVEAACRETGVPVDARVYWDSQRLGAAYGDFIGRVVSFARQHPWITWFEGANEDFQGGEELSRYAEAEIERMKALEAIGRKAIIGNFSCGQPQYSEWPRFRPALEYAAAHGHKLGLHEYSGPVMQWMAGDNQVVRSGGGLAFAAMGDDLQAADDLLAWHRAHYRKATPPPRAFLDAAPFHAAAPTVDGYRLDDACERPGVQGHLTLRYRYVLKLAREWGIGNLQIMITEGGIDDVQPRPGPQGKGWRSYLGTQYANLAPFGDFAQQLGWYYRRLTEDGVIGVDYGFSQAGDWQTFDLSEDDVMRGRVAAEMLRLPRGHAVTPPVPPTPPVVVSAGPFAAIEVLKGQGKLAVARAAYGLPTTAPGAAVKAAVARIEVANPGATWKTGERLRVPGYRVVRLED